VNAKKDPGKGKQGSHAARIGTAHGAQAEGGRANLAAMQIASREREEKSVKN